MSLLIIAAILGLANGYTLHRPIRIKRQTDNGGQGQGQPISFFNQTIPGSEYVSGNFPGAQEQINQFQGAFQGQFPNYQGQFPTYQGQFPSFPGGGQGQFPSFPGGGQGQFPSFPGGGQGQFPSFPGVQGQFPTYQGQFPNFPGSNQIPYYPGNNQYQNQNQGQTQRQTPQRDLPGDQPLSRGGPVIAESSSSSTVVPIISYEYTPSADGSYKYSYETGDGIRRSEEGSQRSVGDPAEIGTVARGSYSYRDADGNEIIVTYVADENGYQPSVTIPGRRKFLRESLLARNVADETANNIGDVQPANQYAFRNSFH